AAVGRLRGDTYQLVAGGSKRTGRDREARRASLDSGGNVLVQVADPAPQAPTSRGLGSRQVRDRAQQTCEQAATLFGQPPRHSSTRLRATGMPDEVGMEFGLERSQVLKF